VDIAETASVKFMKVAKLGHFYIKKCLFHARSWRWLGDFYATFLRATIIVLHNVFTRARNALDLSIHRSNKEKEKFMKKHKGTNVAVIAKYTFDTANTFTLMKHKRMSHTHEWRHHDYYNVVLRWH